jgi:2'-5' RNA ligase
MTLQLDIDWSAQSFFDELRNRYFPKHKLKDAAHITLLYQIHESQERIIQKLSTLDYTAFEIQTAHIVPFANGNAIRLESVVLQALHQELKTLFRGKTTKRDLIKYKPHVTIQLHVTAFKAQQTLNILQSSFENFTFRATGMSLWHKNHKSFEKVWEKVFV